MNFNKLTLRKRNEIGFENKIIKKESILDSLENQLLLFRKLEENVYKHRPNLSSFVDIYKGTKFENEYTQEQIDLDEEYVKNTRKVLED